MIVANLKTEMFELLYLEVSKMLANRTKDEWFKDDTRTTVKAENTGMGVVRRLTKFTLKNIRFIGKGEIKTISSYSGTNMGSQNLSVCHGDFHGYIS